MRLYVVGTDTGIGKTVFSLILTRVCFKKGLRPFYLKPFQTGVSSPCDPESDARFIYSLVPELKGKDPKESTVYCFKNPKAPYFSAKDEGERIDLEKVKRMIEEKEKSFSPVIIEGSGGLLVPVTEDLLIIDTIKLFDAKPILVAKAGLGTINHTLLSIEALKKRRIELLALVLVNLDNTPSQMIQENIEAIKRFSGMDVLGVVRKISDFSKINLSEFLWLEGVFFK